MFNFTITATETNGTFGFSGPTGSGATLNGDTITFNHGTIAVTIDQGSNVTLASSFSLPTAFSGVTFNPPTPPLDANHQYIFTCTNGAPGPSPVTASCFVKAEVAGHLTSAFYDPTMIFNPPE